MLASTQPDPYLKPTGLRAEYIANSSQVIVTWDAFAVRIEDSPRKAVFLEVEGLADYRIDVRAVVGRRDNTTEEGEPAFVYIRTPAPPLPDLRHTLHADISATSATLFWRRPVGFDDYEVLYHVSVLTASSQLKIDRTTNLTELTFEGLQPGTNCSAEVATCLIRRERRHCAGNTTLEFKTLPVDSTDNTPEVSVKALNTSALEVRWLRHHTDSKNPEEYSVSWRPKRSNHASEFATRKISFSPGYHKREFVITDLEPYTPYIVYVTSCSEDLKDRSVLTLTTGQGTTSPLPSNPPENLTLDILTEDSSVKTLVMWNHPSNTGFQGDVSNFTAEALSGTALRLSWAAPVVQDDVKRYRVSWWLHRANQTNKADNNTRTMSFESTSAVIDGLKPYTTYAIEVIVEYELRNVKWHGSPLLQLATTKPEGLPAVQGVHIETTKRTLSSSDVVISWTTTRTDSSHIEVEYRVSLCVGSNSSNQVCRVESVNAPLTRVTFPGVKNFATLVAEVKAFGQDRK
ncbi:hypothetical protein MTO96_003925 [Rhipicephalus appendiculatus]